jgi:hypothetical protein
MLFISFAQPFVKDHSEQLYYDRPNRYPHVVVKFGGIAPFKERVDQNTHTSYGYHEITTKEPRI